MADRLAVLRLHHEFTADGFGLLSGADLVRLAVEKAWTIAKPLAALTVVGVEQAGDRATLRVECAGEPVPVRLVFRRGQGIREIDPLDLPAASMPLSPRRWPPAPSAPRSRSRTRCAGRSSIARSTPSTRTRDTV